MSEDFVFKRARRVHARLRLGISAVSGAGKTMGSLRVAKGIVQTMIDTGQIEGPIEGKIAVIDTERSSAALYAHVVPFDTIALEPPYSVDRYQQAIEAAERAGYAVLIIDQVSHAWAGPGGQLEWIDALKAGARNAMSPWAKVTPVQQEFYDRMLRSPLHIIATMRAKSEYVIEDQVVDGRTKKVPRKIGLSPVQREGIEYEFTSMLDVDLESHAATATKDRTSLFMDRTTKLDEDCGRKLAEWLITGEKGDAVEHERKTELDAATREKMKEREQELAAGVDDLVLSFNDCTTMPDLAAQFEKATKYAKGFLADLGKEIVQGYINTLIAKKDARKESIAFPVGSGAGGTKLTPDDVSRMEGVATANGLTVDEAYTELGVKRFSEILLVDFAACTAKLVAAGKVKAASGNPEKPARRPRAGAAERRAA